MKPATKRVLLLAFVCVLLGAGAFLCACGTREDERAQSLPAYCGEAEAAMLRDSQTPALLRYSCRRETQEDYETTDAATIDDVRKALLQIQVANETELWATDYDDIFVFVTQDGEEYCFSFNRLCLLREDALYELDNDDALWQLAKRIADGKR